MEYRSSLRLTGLVALIISVFSCSDNNSKAALNGIYYYPEMNVYFDSLRSNYYYSLDGGRSWDSMVFNGPAFGAALGERVLLQRSDADIWANNRQHIQQYGGVLLNTVNAQTSRLAREDSINKNRKIAIVRPKPRIIEKEQEVQKGIKGFFNKLFRKKKKPAEEKNKKTDE